MIATIVILLFVAIEAYIRFAPSDPKRWNVPPQAEADKDLRGGVYRVVDTGPDGLARFDAIARATPLTTVLAGSVQDGMITYITRSKVMRFPDYTTVQQDGDTLRIHGRLRFGRSDFGVNRNRVDGWLAALKA